MRSRSVVLAELLSNVGLIDSISVSDSFRLTINDNSVLFEDIIRPSAGHYFRVVSFSSIFIHSYS